MELKAVRAKEGDALILTAPGAVVLIDGGARGVYKRFLRKHILALAPAAGDEPPEIDLAMVSHIDSDHIAGMIDLIDEMREAQDDDARPPAMIRRMWFNSFADAIARTGMQPARGARAAAASLASNFEEMGLDLPGAEHTALMLSSVAQGRRLRRDLKTLAIPVNPSFEEGLALAGDARGPWRRGDLSLRVIGPTEAELDRLRDAWAKQLPKILRREADRQARVAAARSLDTSVYNLASIVAIAESGGKTMLLTGDARGDMIRDWLEAAGYPEGRAHFDLLKIPHHGSDRNVSEAFFAAVTADHYVVSGDGKHGNPEPDMFAMLFAARGDADYLIHMTYAPDEVKAHRDYVKDDKGPALDRVLDAAPWRRRKLRYPTARDTSITVAL